LALQITSYPSFRYGTGSTFVPLEQDLVKIRMQTGSMTDSLTNENKMQMFSPPVFTRKSP